jgi:hypothetical protein
MTRNFQAKDINPDDEYDEEDEFILSFSIPRLPNLAQVSASQAQKSIRDQVAASTKSVKERPKAQKANKAAPVSPLTIIPRDDRNHLVVINTLTILSGRQEEDG